MRRCRYHGGQAESARWNREVTHRLRLLAALIRVPAAGDGDPVITDDEALSQVALGCGCEAKRAGRSV
jgi:hypothetical protein